MAIESCCGQLGKKRAKRPPPAKLPDNPNPKDGRPLIYVGSGFLEVKGAESGLTYTLADYRRHFRADARDVKNLLKSRDFILPP